MSRRNDLSWPNKFMVDPKACRLEIFGLGLRFVIYMGKVRTQTRTRISHLGPAATETK